MKKTFDFPGTDDPAAAERQLNPSAHQRQQVLRPLAGPFQYFVFQPFDGLLPIFPLRIFFEKLAIDPYGPFQAPLGLINSGNADGAAMVHRTVLSALHDGRLSVCFKTFRSRAP